MHTILIVEDNDKNMKLARDLLQAKGYATLEAVNGEDGVRIGLEQVPDLVLMDIQLPDINGIEAFHRLRSDPRTAKVPVVAFTASVTAGDRRRWNKKSRSTFGLGRIGRMSVLQTPSKSGRATLCR